MYPSTALERSGVERQPMKTLLLADGESFRFPNPRGRQRMSAGVWPSAPELCTTSHARISISTPHLLVAIWASDESGQEARWLTPSRGSHERSPLFQPT